MTEQTVGFFTSEQMSKRIHTRGEIGNAVRSPEPWAGNAFDPWMFPKTAETTRTRGTNVPSALSSSFLKMKQVPLWSSNKQVSLSKTELLSDFKS